MPLSDIYNKGVITKQVSVSINDIGSNIKEILEADLRSMLENKCCKDGFVKPGSIRVISFSSGKIHNGSHIQFEVVLEALFAFPVEGMLIECTANNITKAGIKATISDEDGTTPVIIFISRDHFHADDYFLSVKEDDKIMVRVIGQRFELNDPFISVIAELVKPKEKGQGDGTKEPYLVLE